MDLDSSVALITLVELKEYLNQSGTADDAIFQTLLNAASAWVQRYLGRNLLRATYTEYYNGDGSEQLVLRNFPVVSVTSIHIDNLRQFTSNSLIAATDYFLRPAAGIVEAFYLFNRFYTGRANVKVVYVAGYLPDIDKSEALGGMPQEVRMAVKRIVDHHYRAGYTNRKLDISSQTVGDVTTVFKDGDIPKDAVSMLAPFIKRLSSPQFSHAD